MKVCIVGGSGFVGTQLVNCLAGQSVSVDVLCRYPGARRDLSVAPKSRLYAVDVYDQQALRTRFVGADAVINLVGILNEKPHDGSGFELAHVQLLNHLATACEQAGVKRFIQMSALNANHAIDSSSSHYLRTKGEAEVVLHQRKLDVTIFRPSVIFGAQDSFLNRFHGLLKIAPFLPLACPQSRFQPVFVGDVVRSFSTALTTHGTIGQSYDLVGPKTYTLLELVQYVMKLTATKRPIVGLPDWASRLQASIFEWLPGKPFSKDNYRSLQRDSISDNNGLPILGIEPTALEAIAPGYLGARSRAARYQNFRRHAARTQAN